MDERAETDSAAFGGDVGDDVALNRYRTLVNTIDDGVYQLDADGRFVTVNDVIVETTGYTREELLGEHVSQILSDAAVERIEREVSSHVRSDGGDIPPLDLAVRTADGGTVPCEVRINLLIEDGDFQGTIGVARDISEKKQQSDVLGSAQAAYDSITTVLDEADIGVLVLDETFEVAWADETIEEYFGLGRNDLIGRDKRRLIEETVKDRFEDPDRFAGNVLATYDDNSYTEQFECRITAGDGREERWLEHYSKPIESGQYAGGRIEIYSDITDRKRSEDALQDTEERFQSLVDAVEEYAIFRLDPEGNVISWNEGAKKIKGYETEEIVGEPFSTFYTEADRNAGVPGQNLERAIETGSVEDEGWRVKKDGTRFWANVTITAVRDRDGTHHGYLKVTRDMTDRYERERELESELQRILGRISDAFYAVDEDFRFTHVNDRAEELLQHSEEELLDETLWDVFPSTAEIEEIWEAFQTALNEQEPTSYELYYDALDFWVEANLYPSESGISVYFRDITEHKEREQELKRYERTTETIWDGVATLDADDRFVMVNEAFCEMTGYDRGELLGEHVTLIHDETTNGRAEELKGNILADEQEYASIEFELETAAGETIPVEGRFGPYELEDGSIGRTGVTRDVSERKERERELERRTRQQQVVADLGQFALEVDNIDDLMHEAASQVAEVLDNEYCKVLDLDPEAEELLLRQGVGWQEGIVGEETVSSVEADSQAAYTLVNEQPIAVEDLETETRFSEPELLTSHDVKSGISTIIGSIDDPWGILGTHDTVSREFTDEDVSFVQSVANVLAEAIERYRYQEELERLVEDLEESNERLEQFAYAASHDLQEPLRMVSSYLQLIERRYGDDLDEDGEEFLEFAVDGADRMRAMIEALLEYSRVETRGDPFWPVELEAVLADVREDLRMKLEGSDAEITVEALPCVEGDASQLRRVFQNLLDNAIEYSGDEPPRIHVAAERDGPEWIVSIEDEGIGIDPDDQDRVFEVFQRLHPHDEHAGTGIGLALCERIIERHGGRIWIDSDPGEGTTFSVTLPAADDRDA